MTKRFKAELLIILLSIAVLIIVFVLSLPKKPTDNTKSGKISYFMKTEGNNVVLYKNNSLIKIYDGIVLDTLPISDREKLKAGIEFNSIEEADISAEDYDG